MMKHMLRTTRQRLGAVSASLRRLDVRALVEKGRGLVAGLRGFFPVNTPTAVMRHGWQGEHDRGSLWRRSGLAALLLAASAAPVPAASFCPWFGGPYCYTRTMDVVCSAGAQQSTVHVAYTWQNGRAFDGEPAAGCCSGFVLQQFNNEEEDGYQTALARNIKVRGGGRLVTSCQMTWEPGNVHGEQTVVCAGGGEWVAVTIHPAE